MYMYAPSCLRWGSCTPVCVYVQVFDQTLPPVNGQVLQRWSHAGIVSS